MKNRCCSVFSTVTVASIVAGAIATAPALASNNSVRATSAVSSTLERTDEQQPVLMLVSLRHQTMWVFSGDTLVARSWVSTGMPGHRTPTGVFSVLEKRRRHHSNICRAPMPFMQRLTWSGIALHEPNSVPDYPASHGCVRLPGKLAKQLFGYTHIGAHVIVTDEELTFGPISSNRLFYPNGPAPVQEASSETLSGPAATPSVLRISSQPTSGAASAESGIGNEAFGKNFVLRRSLDTEKGGETAIAEETAGASADPDNAAHRAGIGQ